MEVNQKDATVSHIFGKGQTLSGFFRPFPIVELRRELERTLLEAGQ